MRMSPWVGRLRCCGLQKYFWYFQLCWVKIWGSEDTNRITVRMNFKHYLPRLRSRSRIPNTTRCQSRIFCPTPTPEIQLDRFVHHTPMLGSPVEMVKFIMKLLLKHIILAVYHDFHWVLLLQKSWQPNLIHFILIKEPGCGHFGKVGVGVGHFTSDPATPLLAPATQTATSLLCYVYQNRCFEMAWK